MMRTSTQITQDSTKEEVLTAVMQDGEALEHASEALKGDKDVVLAAVFQSAFEEFKHANRLRSLARAIVFTVLDVSIDINSLSVDDSMHKLLAFFRHYPGLLKQMGGIILLYMDPSSKQAFLEGSMVGEGLPGKQNQSSQTRAVGFIFRIRRDVGRARIG